MTEDTRIKLAFDMETNDPDDVFTLCLLATHPKVNLRAVTIMPGGRDQIGLVRFILGRLERKDVLVGAGTPKKDRPHVSGFHYTWLGKVGEADADGSAAGVMASALKDGATHLLTGAPLTNVLHALEALPPMKQFFDHWFCQGGFAGINKVAPEHRLEKFEKLTTCPTFNLNGNVKAALELIATDRIRRKRFVTKNMCHGIFYDEAFHARVPVGAHAGLDLLREGMEVYLQRVPGGKALHDVIAAALAIDPTAAQWAPGKIYRDEKGHWGTRDAPTHECDMVTVALDLTKFESTLAG